MKYGYEGANLGELIQNYKIFNNKLIVTFLDNSICEKPLTKENEIELLNKMLEQAQSRSESSALHNAKSQLQLTCCLSILSMTSVILNSKNVYDFSIKDYGDFITYFSFLLTIIPGFIFIDNVPRYKSKYAEIKELEKYAIYLSIRTKLNNITDYRLFNGVKSQEILLNINTLDNYSLKDIRRIRDNLKNIEKNANNPIRRTKKIGK